MEGTGALLIRLDTAPASDGWGFVGRVMVGEFEAYRTLRAYPTPTEAATATQEIVGRVLGASLAGEEWRSLSDETHRAARRADLNFGLTDLPPAGSPQAPTPDGQPPGGEPDSIRGGPGHPPDLP